MGKLFYQKLAFTNMRKNSQFEIPYLCTGIFTVCAFYMIMALSYNPQLVQATNSETIVSVMALAGRIVAIFSAIILFYTDSFLMKRRKKSWDYITSSAWKSATSASRFFLKRFTAQ